MILGRVFEFDAYPKFLDQALATGPSTRGKRSALADYLGCQSSYISQVIHERVHVSLEHALKIADFLQMNAEEKRYFMLLVQKGKAATVDLVRYYDEQLREILEKRRVVSERIAVGNELRDSDQAIYYSAWYYAAIHILIALPAFSSAALIAAHLRLSLPTVEQALGFLISRGIIRETPRGFAIGHYRTHLGSDSPWIARHHMNWRMKTAQALEDARTNELHYSGLFGLSRADYENIRKLALDYLQSAEAVLKGSKEEALYVVALDLFEL